MQIFSGGFLGEAVPFKAVEEKLSMVLPRLPVSKVIMGWAGGGSRETRSLYEKTAVFLEKSNIEFYLWFPVFSETGVLKSLDPLVDLHGRPLESQSGSGKEENFSFCCPGSRHNIEKILEIFEEEFSSMPFSGIFLDKIRYPSFAQGQRGVFSCFCPHCAAEYADPGQVRDALSGTFSQPLGINGYLGCGTYEFEDPLIMEFFSLKAGFISRSMQRICRYFREKRLKIGFDVFAPFLAPFVGQDLRALSELCDFMKPMMYCITRAPAGLPFETEALLCETGCSNPEKRQRFHEILGLDPRKLPFSLHSQQGEHAPEVNFAARELANLVNSSSSPIYAGMEINRKKNLAEVYPDYIEDAITAYSGAGVRGIVLSWNLLDAPQENLVRVGEVIEGMRT